MPVLKAVTNDTLYMLNLPFVLVWYQQGSHHPANHNLPLAVAVGSTSWSAALKSAQTQHPNAVRSFIIVIIFGDMFRSFIRPSSGGRYSNVKEEGQSLAKSSPPFHRQSSWCWQQQTAIYRDLLNCVFITCYWAVCVFVIPLLGIIFNAFYQVDC